MKPVHTFQPSFSRFILILSSHLRTHFSWFMYFVCKRVCTSSEAVTEVLVGIQVFQVVTQLGLDLLLDKYVHCMERSAQIMHNLKWACYSVSSVFHNSNMTILGTVYCVGINLFVVCGYLSPWHEVFSGYKWSRGLPDVEGRCQYIQ